MNNKESKEPRGNVLQTMYTSEKAYQKVRTSIGKGASASRPKMLE
jgi:hypothetical protein